MEAQYEQALAAAKDVAATPKSIEKLSAEIGEEAARWAFNQWELRARGRTKFELAEQMLFSRPGLEMATHERLAAWRASRFPKDELVADLTCGIGADTIALARRGPVEAFDIDPAAVELCQHNLAVHGLQADCQAGDARDLLDRFDRVLLDPARRTDQRHRLLPDDYEPNPWEMVDKLRSKKLACLKLSPLVQDDRLAEFGGRVEFLSFGRECREACVWLGSDIEPGVFSVHVESGEAAPESAPAYETDVVDGWIHEADPAMIRAHSLGSLRMPVLGSSRGYLTSDQKEESPWLTSYECLWHGPFKQKLIQKQLDSLSGQVKVVKKRGVTQDPDKVRRQLRPSGSRSLCLFLWPDQLKIRAALCLLPGDS